MDTRKAAHAIRQFMGIRSTNPTGGISGIPTRNPDTAAPITPASAVRIASVYRALSIITTSMGQLSLTVERGGQRLDDAAIPAFIRRPCLHLTRREFVEELTLSLATTGNAYILKTRDTSGDILNLTPLNPNECTASLDAKTGRKIISYKGKTYTSEECIHIALMRLPGQIYGLGPIQAAQMELTAARDTRDFAGKWFTATGQPAGILTTDQHLKAEDAKAIRNAWNYRDADGNVISVEENPARIRVLTGGMKYTPILINPRDAQWIEAQQFNTTQIARLFGIPAPLILAAVEGNAQTYSNVEQEWLAFTRFTLAAYIRAIEDALTELTPRGQTVKFNVEALLRTDTKARYEAHNLAISMGLYTPEYARQIEGINL